MIVEARAQAAADSPQLDRFIAAFERIRAGHVDRLDRSDLIDAAIKGMVGVLDSQSSYPDWKLFRNIQHQPPAGLGIQTVVKKGLVKVIAPIDETPAVRVGINASPWASRRSRKPSSPGCRMSSHSKSSSMPGMVRSLTVPSNCWARRLRCGSSCASGTS
jgi:hypothetical protein